MSSILLGIALFFVIFVNIQQEGKIIKLEERVKELDKRSCR